MTYVLVTTSGRLQSVENGPHWEEDTLVSQWGTMLNLMPITHVLQMNEIISTISRANHCGRHMFTSELGARHSQEQQH